jgi:hypothetical protein
MGGQPARPELDRRSALPFLILVDNLFSKMVYPTLPVNNHLWFDNSPLELPLGI